MKTKEFQQLIDKKVFIIPLELDGYIKEISISKNGAMYLIRYLYNMEMKENFFYLNEIRFK